MNLACTTLRLNSKGNNANTPNSAQNNSAQNNSAQNNSAQNNEDSGNNKPSCPSDTYAAVTSTQNNHPNWTCIPKRRVFAQPSGGAASLDEVFNGLLLRCSAAEKEIQDTVWGSQWLRWGLFVTGTAATLTAAALTGINDSNNPDFVRVRNTAVGFGVSGTLLSTITGTALFEQRANTSSGALGRIRAAMDGARAEWPIARGDLQQALSVLRSLASACSETPIPEILQAENVARRNEQLRVAGAIQAAASDAAPAVDTAAKAERFTAANVDATALRQLRTLLSDATRTPSQDPRLNVAILDAIERIDAYNENESQENAKALAASLKHLTEITKKYSLNRNSAPGE
jgi:hypothetical protein